MNEDCGGMDQTCEAEQVDTPRGVGVLQENQQFHEARIDKVANGFIVKVGCQRFVALNFEDVLTGLREYYENPIEAEKKYRNL